MITQENIPYTADEIKAMVKTIEELRKKYNGALERARAINDGKDVDAETGTTTCEYIFPELKVSEDKKMLNACINTLRNVGHSHLAAWLEKQREQHSPIDINKMVNEFAHTEVKGYGIPSMIEVDAYRKGINDAVKEAGDQYSVDFDGYKKVVYGLSSAFMNYLDNIRPEGKMCLSNMECADIEKAFLEMDWAKLYRYLKNFSKEGSGIEEDEEPDEVMQKHKFNVDEWIVTDDSFGKIVRHVDEIRFNIIDKGYVVSDENGLFYNISFSKEHKWHKWTIQDAEDGDILSFETEDCEWILIYEKIIPSMSSGLPHDSLKYHVLLSGDVLFDHGICAMVSDDYEYYIHPATKEQRDMLFNKMR